MFSWLYEAVGYLTETGIRIWLRLFGKKVGKADVPWLHSPVGPGGRIGKEFYHLLAERESLKVRQPQPDAGLVADFDALKGPHFDPTGVKPEIRHFYEHTALYRLDTWTEATLATRFFLWFLVTFVSRRMGQLNFPISSLETSRGMTSEIVQLADPMTGRHVYMDPEGALRTDQTISFLGLTVLRLHYRLTRRDEAIPTL
jgi:hypothetical protein